MSLSADMKDEEHKHLVIKHLNNNEKHMRQLKQLKDYVTLEIAVLNRFHNKGLETRG